jgi:hypothetical protein
MLFKTNNCFLVFNLRFFRSHPFPFEGGSPAANVWRGEVIQFSLQIAPEGNQDLLVKDQRVLATL